MVIPQVKEQYIMGKSLEKLKKDEIREMKVSRNVEASKEYLDNMLLNN
ncbi:hypothetical protein [Bacillus sp. AFS037270]|nr:hypothetical protein [Bacillus sp. AFS037270]